MERPQTNALAPAEVPEQTRRLRTLVRELVADPGLADDLVQGTLVAALQRPPRERAALPAWLDRVLRRKARRERENAERRQRHQLLGARREAVPSAAEVAARLELSRELSAALAELPEAQRVALWLRFFEELPPRVVARRLGVPVETVRTRLKRGLHSLRGRLDQRHGSAWRAAYAPLALPFSAWTARTGVAVAMGASLLGVMGMYTKLLVAASAALLGALALWMAGGGAEPLPLSSAPAEVLADALPSSTAGEEPSAAMTSERFVLAHEEEGTRAAGTSLPPGFAEIRGRMLDPSGAPASDVDLRLRATPLVGEDAERVEQRATSGPDGAFCLRFPVEPGSAVDLSASSPRSAAVRWVWAQMLPGERRDLGDLLATPPATLLVRVLDREGEPLLDPWEVVATNAGIEAFRRMDGRAMRYASGPLGCAGLPLAAQPGVFEVRGLHPGRCRVQAELGVCRSEVSELDLEPGEVRALELRYLGAPPASLVVLDYHTRTLPPHAEHVWLETLGLPSRHPDARQRFEDLPPGSYRLRVDDPRFEPVLRDGLVPGPHPVKVRLRANSSLRLRVLDREDARPVADARIHWERGPRGSVPLDGTPLEDGVIAIDDVAGGDYDLRVSAPGYAPTPLTVRDLQAGESRALELRLERTCTLRGRVLRRSGAALQRAAVELFVGTDATSGATEDWQRLGLPSAVRPDGSFAFEHLRPGRYRIRASAGTENVAERSDLRLEAGREEVVDLRLPFDAWLRVVLRGPEGELSDRARLLLERRDGNQEWIVDRTAPLDAEGSALLGPYAPTALRLAWSFGAHTHPWSRLGVVELRDGEEVVLDRDLSAEWPARLVVTLRDQEGALPGRIVGARVPGSAERGFEAETDREGRAVFPLVRGGQLELYAREQDRAWTFVDPVPRFVPPGGHAELRLDLEFVEASIRCVDAASGEPLRSVRLAVFRADDRDPSPVEWTTDAEGALQLRLPPGGAYRIRDHRTCLRLALDREENLLRWELPQRAVAREAIDLRWPPTGSEPQLVRVPPLR